MPAKRFFVEGVREPGSVVTIDGADAHKIAHVLRLRDGDAIEVVDSAGTLFDARISTSAGTIEALLGDARPAQSRAAIRIDLAQAVPKGSKMDLVVEKATELGASTIVPFLCERTVPKTPGEGKVERWRRLALAAAQQSGRRDVPGVEDVLPSFDALLARFQSYDAVLFPWELASQRPLLEELRAVMSAATRVLVVVGPEGGFSHAEAQAARERGATVLSLGPRILRTETAALALLSVIDAVADALRY